MNGQREIALAFVAPPLLLGLPGDIDESAEPMIIRVFKLMRSMIEDKLSRGE